MKRFLLAIIHTVSWLLARLGARRSMALGSAFGAFLFHVVRIRRRVVFENLQRAFPEKSENERKALALGCYRQLGRVIAETLFLPNLPAAEVAKLIRWHNDEILSDCVRRGDGVIFCMSHMGNWELIGFEGARRGYKFHAVTKVLKGAFNEAVIASRKKIYGELPASGSFDRGVEILKRGEPLALIIDQHRAGNRAIIIDFFGHPAATSPSPALFALRSGAPVIAGWMSVGPDGVYDLWFRGPFPVPEAPTLAEQLQQHTQLLATDLENFIREHPSEWYWVHRRWKVDAAPAVTSSTVPTESS